MYIYQYIYITSYICKHISIQTKKGCTITLTFWIWWNWYLPFFSHLDMVWPMSINQIVFIHIFYFSYLMTWLFKSNPQADFKAYLGLWFGIEWLQLSFASVLYLFPSTAEEVWAQREGWMGTQSNFSSCLTVIHSQEYCKVTFWETSLSFHFSFSSQIMRLKGEFVLYSIWHKKWRS